MDDQVYRPRPIPNKLRRNVKFGKAIEVFKWGGILLFLLAALVAAGVFVWTACRIEPHSDQIAILIRKTGENLAPDEIIATREGQKGIQLEPLPEGRYFYNPYTWDWQFAGVTTVPAGISPCRGSLPSRCATTPTCPGLMVMASKTSTFSA